MNSRGSKPVAEDQTKSVGRDFFLLIPGLADGASSLTRRVVLVGDQISSDIILAERLIFSGSDTAWFNERMLTRGTDYNLDYTNARMSLAGDGRSFDSLRTEDHTDSMIVVFKVVPLWLSRSFGNEIPSATTSDDRPRPHAEIRGTTNQPPFGSSLEISGSKTFRFSSRSASGSDFGQSLDLTISGEISDGVEVVGSVSDRGYDPTYGFSNQRISELDKINLAVRSSEFTGQMGDIEVVDHTTGSSLEYKQVSGVAAEFNDRRLRFSGVAARPKGRFETTGFRGADGLQGPYRISGSGTLSAIVSTSEEVWLDGSKLERGGHKDYVMDYAAGTITFNSSHPIDSRSRIEIDYEPLENKFRQEFLGGGAGVATSDSMFTFSADWVREGDDAEELLLGSYSQSDRDLLRQAGDNNNAARRSSFGPDSLGRYELIVDSLPDSIFMYVGEGNGNYDVSFSYVGAGQGSYRFLGGDHYQFVGPGIGDYLPIQILPMAERTDFLYTRLHASTAAGKTSFGWQLSNHDINLLSDKDDNDNIGSYLSLGHQSTIDGTNGSEVELEASHREASFQGRSRIHAADFDYEYLIPSSLIVRPTEDLVGLTAHLNFASYMRMSPEISNVSYKNSFDSRRYAVSTISDIGRALTISTRLAQVDAEYSNIDSSTIEPAEATKARTGLIVRPVSGLSLESSYERDRRRNHYGSSERGTRYDLWETALVTDAFRLTYERFQEDSLSGVWESSHLRDRFTAHAERRFGLLSLRSWFTYQDIKRPLGAEESILGSMNYSFRNRHSTLSVDGSYLLSDESRWARSVSYLQVDRGQGAYVFEDNEYKPQDGGDFIKVDQILSEQARVRRGEKDFRIRKEFSQAVIGLSNSVQEELLEPGSRSMYWILPFVSDRTQPYLFYQSNSSADIRMIKISTAYAVNLRIDQNREQRLLNGVDNDRMSRTIETTLKQNAGGLLLQEGAEFFVSDVDSYYGSYGGKIDGYATSAAVRRVTQEIELSGGLRYRRAESATQIQSKLISASTEFIRRLVSRGEFKSEIEFYRQFISGADNPGLLPYRLTDNRLGSRGIHWSVTARYGGHTGTRLNFSLSGRHSDDRPPRFYLKGEFVAGI